MTNSILETTPLTQQDHKANFRLEIKKKSDKLMDYFLAGYFLVGLALAFFYETWLIGVGVGSLSLIAYYSIKKLLPDSDLYQYVLGVILGVFMAQFIYQMHGLFEMHFFAFIGSAILITYQNWKLQVPMLLVVIVHHITFGYLQNTGVNNIFFTQLDYFELKTFIIHFLLAAVIFFTCGLWSFLLKKSTDKLIDQTIEMERLQELALISVKEQSAIESNNRFSYAAQATSDAIWDRNYANDSIFWGDGYKTLFGYDNTSETNTMAFWKSKVHPDDLAVVTKITEQAKNDSNTTIWSCEYRFLKADNQYAFVKEKAIILRDETGTPCRTIGALQDITEIRQRELKLEELNDSLAQEKYYIDTLMNNMPDAIYFKDRESRFIRVSAYMVNKHLNDHPGATINDILGKTDFDLLDEKHAKEAYDDEQEIQRTKKPKIDYIERETLSDGSLRWVASTKLPMLNAQKEVIGTFGISRDVTKIKLLEKQQHEALLDKAVAQSKFEIASEVMHDIGNAVSGFSSCLTRIKRLQATSNSENLKNLIIFFETQKEAIATAIGEAKSDAVINMLSGIAQTQHKNELEIIQSVSQQFNIVTNIEEILNIQRKYVSGHESKERKPANLKSIIDDSLSMLFTSVEKNAINMSLNIADNLPPIKGDRTKLMQLMLNVIKNSIEATEENTTEKNISINVYAENNRLILKVEDNGRGFDSAVAGQLFSRGFSTKTNGKGQSLYNCKTIVESHEGTIDITSDGKGKGCLTTIGFKILAA